MKTKTPSVVENYCAKSHQKHRRRRLAFITLGAILFLGLFGYGARRLFVDSDTFAVKQVEVMGNKMVSKDEILSLMQGVIFSRHKFLGALLGTKNMLIWPASVSSPELAVLPAVEQIAVDKNYGTKEITITVKEREPYGIWCQPSPTRTDADGATMQIGPDGNEVSVATSADVLATSTNIGTSSLGQAANTSSNAKPRLVDIPPDSAPARQSIGGGGFECWWFDKTGMMFQKGIAAEGNLIRRVDDYTGRVILPGSLVLDGSFMPALISIFHTIEDSNISVEEVRLNNMGLEELEVDTHNGPKFFFSLRFAAHEAASVIASLRAQTKFSNLEYIDFRVEGRVFYK